MDDETRASALGTMPQPPEVPLYVSVARAAELAGVSYDTMSSWANRAVGAIPHITAGRKKLVRVAAIPAYAAAREDA